MGIFGVVMSDPLASITPVIPTERQKMFSLPVDVPTPCSTMPLKEADKLFFSESPKRIAMAKDLCASCPITAKCLQFALDEEIEFGIFGGSTPNERKVML